MRHALKTYLAGLQPPSFYGHKHPAGHLVELCGVLLLLYCVTKALIALIRQTRSTKAFEYLEYERAGQPRVETIFVDCTHPTARTITHHRGHNNPKGLRGSDTSTGLVLNAISAQLMGSQATRLACSTPFVSSNHFDVDSFLSCWSYINRATALKHEAGDYLDCERPLGYIRLSSPSYSLQEHRSQCR
jgi:hypothetical protein